MLYEIHNHSASSFKGDLKIPGKQKEGTIMIRNL